MNNNRPLRFLKMNGAGNDFVFLTPEMAGRPVTGTLAKRLLDRHFGIGGDQLLVLQSSRRPYDYELKFFNSDGSTAEMCGNGTRAVAYYLHHYKNVSKNLLIKTKRGPIGIAYRRHGIEVDMGSPILEGSEIPARHHGEIKGFKLRVKERVFMIHAVSMGNPHCVIFVPDVDKYAVAEIGPLIEHHPFFPKRVNVEFVQIRSRRLVRARVWERGAGETLACGTGACAIAVASARLGVTENDVRIDLPGGQLRARWDRGGSEHVYLSGPAEVNYEGRFYV